MLLKSIYRYVAFHGPTNSIRVAFYRKAGAQIGNNVYLGTSVFLDVVWGKIIIKDNSYINAFAKLVAHSLLSNHAPETEEAFNIVIEENVFVGLNAIILDGVTIGKNSVVGAGAIVLKNVPSNVLVAGNPAVVKKVYTTYHYPNKY
jgi:maltose O-acetyltransferase